MEHGNKPLYTHRWIRANMGKIYKRSKVKEQVGTETIVKNKSLFSSEKVEVEKPVYETREEWVDTGKVSDKYIDIQDFGIRLTNVCNELAEEGYDVLQIISTIDGRYSYEARGCNNGGWGYGYGYSVTDGAVIIAKLRCHSPS